MVRIAAEKAHHGGRARTSCSTSACACSTRTCRRTRRSRRSDRIFPEVRNAESRYIPVLIRDTLEGTGQWGQVRVLPRDGTGMEVFVDGRILESDGRELRARDRGHGRRGAYLVAQDLRRRGRHARLQGRASSKPRDPFENVYNTFANDLLAARRALTVEQRSSCAAWRTCASPPTSRRTPSAATSRRTARALYTRDALARGGRSGGAAHAARARARLRAGRHAQRVLRELRRQHGRAVHATGASTTTRNSRPRRRRSARR